MALPEVTNYDPTVYEILITDAVEGYNPSNPNTAANVGISNQAALNLANRTNWLYVNINNILDGTTIPTGLATLLSPEFTGSPEAPTPALGDNSVKLSTTAFVQGTVNGLTAISVAGGSNVPLTSVQAGSGILNFTGALTANIAVIMPNTSGKWIVENNTTGAFTLTVKTAAGTGVAVTQGKNNAVYGDGTNIYLAANDFSNIVLTGTPTTTTPPIGDQSLKIANTDFVWQFVDGAVNIPVGGGSNVTLTQAQYGNGILLLQGALTAAISIELPSQSGQWIVANQTTGAFGLTMAVTGSAGAKATVPQGQSVIVYSDGTNVILAGAAASSSFSVHSFTATAAQTDFVCSYTPGNILVIQNGSTLGSVDYTATDGANVILATGAKVSDNIQVIAFASFTVANAVTWTGGTMLGALQLFGGDTGTTAAQYNNSTLLATTAFVQGRGLQASVLTTTNATGPISASTVGGTLVGFGTTAITQTLPSAASVPAGGRIEFMYVGSATMPVVRAGTDTINVNNSAPGTSLTLGNGDTLTLESNGVNGWYAVHGSVQLGSSAAFGSSLAAAGYQKLPSGLVIQWGSFTASSSVGAAVAVTFTLAFPGSNWQVFLTPALSSTATSAAWYDSNTTTGFNGRCNVAGLYVAYFAIGH
jgi:hypothetical protein